MKRRTALIVISLAVIVAAMGCSTAQIIPPVPATAENTQVLTPTKTPFVPPTNTSTPIATATVTLIPTPQPTATPVFITIPAGNVICPILLYHHIDANPKADRYSVEPAMFEQQMQWLYDHGYRTITVTDLINLIKNGGQIPERPAVITFDDGNMDIFNNAFPIMQKYGFIGVFYIVSGRLGGTGIVTIDQIRQMLQAGWELGSHSRTHPNLAENHDLINTEMYGSRTDLETTFTVPVNTFAYPFGRVDDVVMSRAYKYGFLGAMGLGTSYTHTSATLFYLSREEVRFEYDLAKFITLLPWQQ